MGKWKAPGRQSEPCRHQNKPAYIPVVPGPPWRHCLDSDTVMGFNLNLLAVPWSASVQRPMPVRQLDGNQVGQEYKAAKGSTHILTAFGCWWNNVWISKAIILSKGRQAQNNIYRSILLIWLPRIGNTNLTVIEGRNWQGGGNWRKKGMKGISRVMKMFHILFWMVVIRVKVHLNTELIFFLLYWIYLCFFLKVTIIITKQSI